MAKPFRKPDSRNYYIEVWSHGQRRTLSLNTDNYGIARAMAGRLEHEARTTGLKLPTQTEVESLAQSFIRHLRTHLRPKSAQNDIGRLCRFFGIEAPNKEDSASFEPLNRPRQARDNRKESGTFPVAVQVRFVEQITSSMVADFLTRMAEQRGVGPKTWNEYRGILQRFFSWAIRTQGVIMPGCANPVDVVPRRRVAPPSIRFLTLPQMHRQLEVLEDHPQLRAMVAICIYAGLRREEMLWLTPADVDLTRGILHVRAKTVGDAFWKPKTNRNRKVRISDALRAALADYSAPATSRWYFPSPLGQRWDPDNFSAALRELNQKHGLAWGCADFRHTFGTQLAMAGRDERTIAELMGNSPAIVRRHYAAWLPEAHPEAVEFDRPEGPAPMSGAHAANARIEAERRGLRLVR